MNKRFFKNISMDLIISWPLLWYGIFKQYQYVGNIATAYFWLLCATAFIVAIIYSDEKQILKRIKDSHYQKRTKTHIYYSFITMLIEFAVIASVGRFVLAAIYLVCNVLVQGLNLKCEETYDREYLK